MNNISISSADSSKFSINIPNVVISTPEAKIVFNTPIVNVDNIFGVYLSLKSYLNSFSNINL
jgi:hypothetical protein